MKLKDKKIFPVRLIVLIKIFLVFIICSAFLSIYGLNFEKKISNIYIELDEINLKKKYVDGYKKSFSNFYANGIIKTFTAKDFYLIEDKETREINYCIKQWEVLRSSTFYTPFFEEYQIFINKNFNEPVLFSKIEKDYETFLKWHETHRNKKPCLKEVHRKFVENHRNDLINGTYKLIFILDKNFNHLFQREDILYKKITSLSKKSSNIYLATFLILILSTTLIIIGDVMTNRGNRKRS